MKKRFCAALMGILLLVCLTVTAFAEESSASWNVTFTADNKLESNYTMDNLSQAVYNMQPGDAVTLTLHLKNDNPNAANWYLTNTVLKSLEENSVGGAAGGAYEYHLTYTSANSDLDLFDSDAVGGETNSRAAAERVGLENATEGLEEYVFLETLAPGATATVNLRVALDGETQGNAYQNTLARLQLNFAVDTDLTETRVERRTTPGDGTVVDTGDSNEMLPFIIAAGVSGILLLVLALIGLKERKNQKKTSHKAAKALCMLLACLLIAGTLPLGGLRAAAATANTYKVRLFPGAQGTIDATQMANMCSVKRGEDDDTEVTSTLDADGCLTLEGLHYGDQVSFNPNAGVVLSDNKYYVRGVRVSGEDNSTVNIGSFTVTEDLDYVVAYGILADSVEYTVRYEDEAGNELAPSVTYRGNVGDKPVVAYQYIEGYQPQARNLGKTLVSNAAENVFTFVYTPLPENVLTEVVITTTPGGVTVITPVPPPEIEDIEEPVAPLGPDEEEEQPNEPPEYIDLDDEETPLGPGGDQVDENMGGIGDTITEAINDFATPLGNLPTVAKVGMGVGAVAVIGLVVLMILKKRKKKNAETQK